jgi:hypothetical protein
MVSDEIVFYVFFYHMLQTCVLHFPLHCKYTLGWVSDCTSTDVLDEH